MKANEKALMNRIFFDDGSLRDIYITDTSLETWQIVWEFIKDLKDLTISIDGQKSDGILNDIIEIFFRKERKSYSFKIFLGWRQYFLPFLFG